LKVDRLKSWRILLKVTVKFFAQAREITRTRDETLEIEDSATVMSILRVLVNKHGDKLNEYLFDPKTSTARPHLKFFVDGREISLSQGFETALTDGCTLSIVPPVSGG
jgi:MoaD family protein